MGIGCLLLGVLIGGIVFRSRARLIFPSTDEVRNGSTQGPVSQPRVSQPKTDMTLAAFKAQWPQGPKAVRVTCWLRDWYAYPYENCKDTHYSISMMSLSPDAQERAWALQKSKAGTRLYEVLKDGDGHDLTLRIAAQGPDGKPTPRGQEGIAILEVLD